MILQSLVSNIGRDLGINSEFITQKKKINTRRGYIIFLPKQSTPKYNCVLPSDGKRG